MAIFSSLKNLFDTKVSRQKFLESVFSEVRKYIYDKAVFAKDLSYIEEILSSGTVDQITKENLLMPFYLRLEKHISEEQEKKRIPVSELRERIREASRPERCDSDFTLLFLPVNLIRIRLFEKFSEEIIERASGTILEPMPVFSGSNQTLSAVRKGDVYDWSGFEKNISEIPESDGQLESARQILGGGVSRIFDKLNEKLDVLRAEMIYRDAFNKMKARFKFVESEVPQILQIVPEAILREERPEMFSREKLSGELKTRNTELEFTLSRLSEEKNKVEAERAKLAQALEDLKRLDSVKAEFIGIISHQFRTPLSAIRWNNDLLFEELADVIPDAEKQKQLSSYSGAIMNRVIFLINILEDIFDVLAVENKQLAISKKPSPLWETVDEAINSLNPEAKLKNIKILFNKAEAPQKLIQMDAHKIGRACMIILRNAVNYSPANSEISIVIGTMELSGKPAQFCTIKDSGIGVSQEDMPKLFTKFFRAKNAISTVADGAGLGLYLVKNFVEAHGGAVGLESELGKGSAFSIILPEE